MTTLITKYPLYVFSILSMCLFCGGCFYRSINKEKNTGKNRISNESFYDYRYDYIVYLTTNMGFRQC